MSEAELVRKDIDNICCIYRSVGEAMFDEPRERLALRIAQRHEKRVADLEQQLAEAWALSDKYREERDDNAHVIVECGVCPGVDSNCTCDACRRVALSLDEAGFVEDVEADDRWWDEAAEAGGDRNV